MDALSQTVGRNMNQEKIEQLTARLGELMSKPAFNDHWSWRDLAREYAIYVADQEKALQQLTEWKAKQQSALIAMAVALVGTDYKGDGILDGIEFLKAELADYKSSFDLYYRASQALMNAYKAAHPEFPQDAWPDTTKVNVWAAAVLQRSQPCPLLTDDEDTSNPYIAPSCGTKFQTYEAMANHERKHAKTGA